MAERIDGVPCQKKRKHSTDGTDDDSEIDTEQANVDDKSDDDNEIDTEPDVEINPGFLPSDVVLVVEDQHLHVNKDLLAAASPVFATWLKKEWQNDQGVDNTKKELLFPGKSYDDMVTFLQCLLPIFSDTVTDETLDIILPLADEYQAEALITKCEEVVRLRAESVSNTNTYIPPSRIVTYVRMVDQFKLHKVKEYVVRLASYLKSEELETVPDYANVSTILQREIYKSRAKLLESICVSKVTEAEKKMHQFKIPLSALYMAEWKQNVSTIVEGALLLLPENFLLWKETPGNLFNVSDESQISPELVIIFACMSICDRFNFLKIFAKCIKRLESLTISKDNFIALWSKQYPILSFNEHARMERYGHHMCKCTCFPFHNHIG